MTGGGGAYSRIDANEDTDQIGSQRVGEAVDQVSVL